jgi:hypothetical protein
MNGIKCIKIFLSAIFILFAVTGWAAPRQEVINIKVQGVSCPFCIQVLVKNISNLAHVSEVKINTHSMQLVVAIKLREKPDMDLINKTILASGYLPLKTNAMTVAAPTSGGTILSGHIAIKSQACNSCHNSSRAGKNE